MTLTTSRLVMSNELAIGYERSSKTRAAILVLAMRSQLS
jgi:hypothetical protein